MAVKPQKLGRRPTLASVAERVGVSRTTVSNAYSHPDQLSQELRERIFAAARELGYPGPNPSARALSLGRTGVVGLVFPESLSFAFDDPVAQASLAGMGTACDDLGLALLLIPTSAEQAGGLEIVRSAACDGLILYSLPDDHPLVEAAQAKGIPVVSIDQPSLTGVSRVGVDEEALAHAQVSHLLELGHRRLALVGYRLGPDARQGPQDLDRLLGSSYFMNRSRARGIVQGLDAVGLRPADLTVVETPETSRAAGRRAVEWIRLERPDVTGVIVDSDTLARGVVEGLTAAGCRVPEDVSVIGADDNPDAVAAHPTITTIASPARAKGYHAVRIVAEAATGAETVPHDEPWRLVLRESTGPAPGR